MSRIGESPILIPNGVQVSLDGLVVSVNGPKGSLATEIRPEVKVEIVDSQVLVKRKRQDKSSRAYHGLTRSLISNMVVGVEKGWEKKLELVGVGYRVQANGDKLNLSVGYSHPVEITSPEGIDFKVEDNTKITVTGIDKGLVGQIAADIRKVRPPEVYQGKGIRYAGERVRRKAGKAGKAATK